MRPVEDNGNKIGESARKILTEILEQKNAASELK